MKLRYLGLALALLVSGWMVSGVVAQSTIVAPFFREVNSAAILEALGNLDLGEVQVEIVGFSTEAKQDSLITLLSKSSRSDTFTEAGNGTAVDVSSTGKQWFGVQVKGTGASATSWTVNLQASLDGTNYSTILTHSDGTDDDGSIAWISTPAPALYFRSNVSAVTLGSATNIVVTIVGSR